MKHISVGQLRQNPTSMLDEVESGESYTVLRHRVPVARVVPVDTASPIIPPKKTGPSRVTRLPRIALPDDMSVEELLDDMKDDW